MGTGEAAGLVAPMLTTLALDIGGTKTAAGLVGPSGVVQCAETIVSRTGRLDSGRSDHGAEAFFADVTALADRVLSAAGRRPDELLGIGVGCGGPMLYPTGIVSTLTIPCWRDFPLRARLEARYDCPVIVDNDAKALAVAESWIGAGQGARCLLGMVGSTSVGVAQGAGDLLLRPLRRALAEDARLDFTRGIEEAVLLSDLGLVGPLAGAAGLLCGALLGQPGTDGSGPFAPVGAPDGRHPTLPGAPR